MIQKVMESVTILLNTVAQLEQESLNTYQIYADITDHFGLKRLLLTLEEDVKAHIRRLSDLISRPGLDKLFDAEKAALLPDSFQEVEYAFDANMEYKDFLQMILRREEAVAERYQALHSVAQDQEIQILLKRMAEDCQKHVWLARDRYDLESLI
jgi:bacterioferritin (cytochrome b1)